MLILVMRIAQAQAFMFHLTVSSASKRQKSGITTYPLLTTRRFDQRRLGITTKPAMLASNRRGFHAIVSHELPLCGSGESRSALRSADRCIGSRIILLKCCSNFGIASIIDNKTTGCRVRMPVKPETTGLHNEALILHGV